MVARSLSKSLSRTFFAEFLVTIHTREVQDIVYKFIVGSPGVVKIVYKAATTSHTFLTGSLSGYTS